MLKRNDAETVVVRPGCKFVGRYTTIFISFSKVLIMTVFHIAGYDHDSRNNIRERGEKFEVNALNDDVPKVNEKF